MESRIMKFYAKDDHSVVLRAIHGHFATSHSHVNYYIDVTGLRTRCSEATAVAKHLVGKIVNTTVIDTIVCMDGCEVVGAYMAAELEARDFVSTNSHETVYVITPEFNSNNQMIFRDNLEQARAPAPCVHHHRADHQPQSGVHPLLRRHRDGHLLSL